MKNKIDALTMGAMAFAGFAVLYVLSNRKQSSTGNPDADAAYGAMTTQRQEVGAYLGMNLDFMNGGLGLLPSTSKTTTVGSYGLQAPAGGFWAI